MYWTERARIEARVEREAKIVQLDAEGKTVRQIAERVGVSVGTVSGVQKRHSSGIEQGVAPPVWKQKLDELSSDPAQNWSAALKAFGSAQNSSNVGA